MLGLILTSLGFLIPAWCAWRRRRWGDAAAAGTLAATSIAYHGTRHPIAHAVDKTVAHALGMVYTIVGLRGRNHRRTRWMLLPFGTGLAIYVFITNGANAPFWHMSFHVLEQAAWLGRIYAPEVPAGPAVPAAASASLLSM